MDEWARKQMMLLSTPPTAGYTKIVDPYVPGTSRGSNELGIIPEKMKSQEGIWEKMKGWFSKKPHESAYTSWPGKIIPKVNPVENQLGPVPYGGFINNLLGGGPRGYPVKEESMSQDKDIPVSNIDLQKKVYNPEVNPQIQSQSQARAIGSLGLANALFGTGEPKQQPNPQPIPHQPIEKTLVVPPMSQQKLVEEKPYIAPTAIGYSTDQTFEKEMKDYKKIRGLNTGFLGNIDFGAINDQMRKLYGNNNRINDFLNVMNKE